MAVKQDGSAAAQNPDKNSPGRTIARLSRWTEQALVGAELSMPQFRVLVLLADGSSAAKGLARGLDVSPPTVTTIVDGLVERGFVERIRSDEDRRRVDHRLTDAGRRALCRADAATTERLDDLCSYLATSEAPAARAGLDIWARALDRKRAALVHEHLS